MSSAPPGRSKRWSFPLRDYRRLSNTLVVESGPNNISLGDFQPFLVTRRFRRGQYLYTLPFNDPLAREHTFARRWEVLPNEVADISCRNMTPEQLLEILNTIFDTPHLLDNTLYATLSDFIDDDWDLGQIYGHLRHYWSFSRRRNHNMGAHMQNRQQRDDNMREFMINNDLIVSPVVPPRRIWDLLANRVIPWCHCARVTYAHQVTPVSHSWRPPSERHSVLTAINGKEWRVPIPRDTTLDAIRNELLLLGAEYVWLDVLCLRQFDEHLPEQEDIRKREWRLDIPTIGNIYPNMHSGFSCYPRAVIIYFNGLGRPFCDGAVDPGDDHHWMNRVWTLQELGRRVIIGGLQHKLGAIDLLRPSSWPSTVSHDFLRLLSSQPIPEAWSTPRLSVICEAIRRRSYSNPVDQVACLSYLLLQQIPIYDPDTAPEVAWGRVVENMRERDRMLLLFTDFGIQPGRWQPTWMEFINCTRFENRRMLCLAPLIREVDANYVEAIVYEKVYIDVPQAHSDGEARGTVYVGAGIVRVESTITICKWSENLDSGAEYVLVCCSYDSWVVAKKISTRMIYGQRALDVVKVAAVTANWYGAWLVHLTTRPRRLVVFR